MLAGTRALVDVDPILVSSNPGQLAALRTLLAALQQAEALRASAAARHEAPVAESSTPAGQLLPEVRTALH